MNGCRRTCSPGASVIALMSPDSSVTLQLMNELFEASWRIYPGAALVVLGVLIALRGFGAEVRAFRSPPGDPATPLAMMRGFRRGILGFAVAALAAAWLWQLGWLAILAGIITGEELLESSLVVFGLTHGGKLRLHG